MCLCGKCFSKCILPWEYKIWEPLLVWGAAAFRASPLFRAKLGATKWDLADLICVIWSGPHRYSPFFHCTASLSPHYSHSEWIVGFVNTIHDKKLTKNSQILRKVGTARVPLGSGEWRLGARISRARLRNLGWCVCGGAPFEDRPQSSPCWASLARKSGDALRSSLASS
jgi:hypothetical protein